MEAFELQDKEHCSPPPPPPKKIKDESIITNKVYDSCRRQDCLTARVLGPAIDSSGNVIQPPEHTASVSMSELKICKIHVVNKKPCSFRKGFWDINIRYTFDYKLTFQDSNGCTLSCVMACNTFNSKVTLFGSTSNDLVTSTDLFTHCGESVTFDASPFVWVEAKAVGLEAKLHHCKEVHCTIGLFSILKLFRLIHLNVQSTGFCTPKECEGICDIHPCEYFADLDFPLDIFNPPPRK